MFRLFAVDQNERILSSDTLETDCLEEAEIRARELASPDVAVEIWRGYALIKKARYKLAP